jgi:hypothetical protein
MRGGELLKARALAPRELHRSLLLSVELISLLFDRGPPLVRGDVYAHPDVRAPRKVGSAS